MKRIISVLLAATMAFGMVCTAASAETTPQKPVYHYVALGDSIAAGYGLSGDVSVAEDPALILTEDLLANPIQGAYPALFGAQIAEWGEERGYDVTTTNLGSCAYRAEDVEKVIYEEGYCGTVAKSLFGLFMPMVEDNPLTKYHEFYTDALQDADLVSIQLGGNDLIMGVVTPMISGSNPILSALGRTMAMIFVGMDTEQALGVGLMTLESNKDKITYETYTEALSYLTSFYRRAEACVDIGAENVSKVIDAVRSVNSDADIAVMSIFNPYGNSLQYNGQVQNLSTVFTNILLDSVDYYFGSNLSWQRNARKAALRAIVQKDFSYTLQYLLAGKSIDALIVKLNEKLEKVAEEAGVPFVDVYSISNENNLDPHPDARRHKEIADKLTEALYQTVIDGMPEIPDVLIGDVDGDGNVTIFDATAIQRYLAGEVSDDFIADAADFDGDGEITIFDVTAVQRSLAGL